MKPNVKYLFIFLSLLFPFCTLKASQPDIQEPTFTKTLTDTGFYYLGSSSLKQLAQIAQISAMILRGTQFEQVANEFELFKEICHSISMRFSNQLLEKSQPSTLSSWHMNEKMLSQIPMATKEAKELISFLNRRWLSKANGYYTTEVDLVAPCFGFHVQVHPKTTNCYIRDPQAQASQNYENSIESWKTSLPEPKKFPLVLTRPFSIKEYLPKTIDFKDLETYQRQKGEKQAKVFVDMSSFFNEASRGTWDDNWMKAREKIHELCLHKNLDFNEFIFFQSHQKDSVGGIRILALDTDEANQDHQFLLEWISHFGLSANQIELDRWKTGSDFFSLTTLLGQNLPQKKEVLSHISDIEIEMSHFFNDIKLMIQGTLNIYRGLINSVTLNEWDRISSCPTKGVLTSRLIQNIQREFYSIKEENFFRQSQHIEEIHANLSSLLEVFSPLKEKQFPTIFQNALKTLPDHLKSRMTFGLHSSAMTTLGGIFKATEKLAGRVPVVLLGDNSYFECVHIINQIANAKLTVDASLDDFREADVLLVQFNPVWKRGLTYSYEVEDISLSIRKALFNRTKPLVIALDATLDLLDSPRASALLEEFEKEIEEGLLNIISFRSGLKFDLFGMDNYCGGPFYMIHNGAPHWNAFNLLTSDPVLQTDRLSYDWFSLSFEYASKELTRYQERIFENTRAILDRIPQSLYRENAAYRVIPFDEKTDPSFIDIHITGPFHQARGAALVGGLLYLRCMETGHPIFYRRSLGFYHPNFGILFNDNSSTIRLTIGLDPAQIDVFVDSLARIDTCNFNN